MVKKTPKAGTVAAGNLAQASVALTSQLLKIMDDMVKAGASNLMQGYASTIISTNFLWKAGLIDREAKDRIYLLGDLLQALAGVSDIGALFGSSSPFTPQLHTNVTQSTEGERDILKAGIEDTKALAALAAKAGAAILG